MFVIALLCGKNLNSTLYSVQFISALQCEMQMTLFMNESDIRQLRKRRIFTVTILAGRCFSNDECVILIILIISAL